MPVHPKRTSSDAATPRHLNSPVTGHSRSCSSGKGYPYHLRVPFLPHKLENVIVIIDIDDRCCDQRPRLLFELSRTYQASLPNGNFGNQSREYERNQWGSPRGYLVLMGQRVGWPIPWSVDGAD